MSTQNLNGAIDHASASRESVSSYAEVAQRAQTCRSILATKGIKLHNASALGQLFRNAERVAEAWATGSRDGDIRQVLNAAHADRISQSIILLQDELQILEPLKRIAGSDMNLSLRNLSQGKDALWELNLLAFLRQRQVQANLIDPPDIVAELGFGPYGIACKKVYSERGVEAQMRKGAKRLLPFQGHGLIALNLDDLAPSETLLRCESKETASAYLHQFNLDFVERHRRVLQRFVMDGKCDGILVSTTTPSDIEHSETRLNTFTQTALWTLNEISLGARLRIDTVGQTITQR
ncbi:hypothetical protein [Cupriavidus sp. H18C2]|uniref:hypothetical protein n=1 Tax=Cupriavidus sp. H18C2 TaxID=3241602 RepID=UPI003BF7BD31